MSRQCAVSATRAARADDLPAIREIDRLSFDRDDQYSEQQYSDMYGSDCLRPLVLERDGVVTSWMLVDLARPCIRIRSLATHPDFRRTGCARKLILHVLDIARSKGVDLLVEAHNHAALALYESCGFRTAGGADMPNRIRMRRR